MSIISRVILLVFCALALVACDFHGPWDYYPEEREVFTGIYTYGYVPANASPRICFSKVYELDETAAENFAFYDSAHVSISGHFALVGTGGEEVDSTVVLRPESEKPNCFSASWTIGGIVGESYEMKAFFKWDSAGHKAKTTYSAVATIPEPVKIKGLNAPQQDGSYEWMEYKNNMTMRVKFLEFPLDMQFIKCALEYDKSIGGVLSILDYSMKNGESMNTTVNKMLEGLTEADSMGYTGIAMHDPLERQAALGFTENSWITNYNPLDTLYLPNMMLPLGEVDVYLYATDHAYVDYINKVKASVSDSRVIPESNIENGMGVFFGRSQTRISLDVAGDGVDLDYIAWQQCGNTGSKGWDSRACRLYQDVACVDMPIDSIYSYGDLIEANAHAYEYMRDITINTYTKTCYSSHVKMAMMLDTTKWSVFLPDTISNKDKSDAYADGLQRYCVASNFKSNSIADCGELEEQCIESTEKNKCKKYLWNWCADRNWDLDYEQCKAALVSRYYIEEMKSSILKRQVDAICAKNKYPLCGD